MNKASPLGLNHGRLWLFYAIVGIALLSGAFSVGQPILAGILAFMGVGVTTHAFRHFGAIERN